MKTTRLFMSLVASLSRLHVVVIAVWLSLDSGRAADAAASDAGGATKVEAKVALDAKASQGYRLFDHNCAHCHGDDARGDEGPDLHGLKKSDQRIDKIIKGGIKGEMPAFGKKFNDGDVQALIAYLRTLKE
jgi:mono/diheme cytochrome c family protein